MSLPHAQTAIHSARLVMRRAREDDLAAVHAIMSDPEVMRYWSTPPHADVETTRAWLDGMITAPPEQGDDFVLEHQGRVVGKLGAWRLPEVGYYLAREAWGQGLALEALRAFTVHAFAHRTDHLTADVDPRNLPSLRLLSRAAFRETHRAARTWEVGGVWCDSVYLRLDRA